jgi:hypothetical protein
MPGSPSVAPSAAPSRAASPVVAASAPVSPPPSATASAPVAVDDDLLAVLPPTIGGLDRQHDVGLDGQLASDPAVAAAASAIATGLYVDPANEFVYAAVIRVRPGRFSDGFFRDWRDTFDRGACAQAGGVTGNAEAEIGGRETFIGSCAGGLRTYHTFLVERGLIVSASAVGERRLGEALIRDLRP